LRKQPSSSIQPEFSMAHGQSLSWQGRQRRAFTLAELLIVIAIIAVLIGILLPALSAARRSAQTVKCLASLKQLGSAFQQYAQENNRAFPVTRWYPGAAGVSPWGPGVSATESSNTTDRTWIDMLAKYAIKVPTYGDYKIYGTYQYSSVFWGCPAYNVDNWDGTGATDRKYSLSYGMSQYPIGPFANAALTAANGGAPTSTGGGFGNPGVSNYAAVYTGGTVPFSMTGAGKGKFFKMEQWGRHSQDKGLLADAQGYDIICSANWDKAEENASPITNIYTQPKSLGLDYPLTAAPAVGTYISVDATRHLAPTADKKKIIKGKGVNMLFVDGHATTVSPREAWIATWGGGTDTTR